MTQAMKKLGAGSGVSTSTSEEDFRADKTPGGYNKISIFGPVHARILRGQEEQNPLKDLQDAVLKARRGKQLELGKRQGFRSTILNTIGDETRNVFKRTLLGSR